MKDLLIELKRREMIGPNLTPALISQFSILPRREREKGREKRGKDGKRVEAVTKPLERNGTGGMVAGTSGKLLFFDS